MKNNELLMIYGTDYKKMTKDLLEAANLISRIPDKNSLIGIKPNLVSASEASWGATTHPEVVAGLIEYLREKGCPRIVMLEGSWVGGRTAEALEVCGYNRLSEEYQVEFWDMQKDKGETRDCAGMELSVCERVKQVDFLINVPVLKGHCQTKITCALKNLKGLIPNKEKRRFHSMGLHKPIAHLNAGIHQDFILVDNICGDLDFEDGGNPVVTNRILAAADPVLCDAFVCKTLGYAVDEVPYVRLAESLGIGCADLSQAVIRQIGENEEEETALPRERKIVALQDAVEEVDSCSACYGYLIPALEMLRQEGLLEKLDTKICIGQGYKGKSGKLGIGSCTRAFAHSLKGCPPTENEIYEFLKEYVRTKTL
ncbi:MAG: DUF362 domain-containing protein [Eubacteriales bacterium]|nr:DUF362 domain-containing protein [Eubacteriales bacterium]